MGAIAEAFVAYAQPLIDQTDGSQEQISKALAISQLCYNLALLPEDSRDQALTKMKGSLEMDDDEFEDFRSVVINPMLQQYQEMFPPRQGGSYSPPVQGESAPQGYSRKRASNEAFPGTRPYAPCPCESGKKYKFCCRMKKVG